MLSGGASVEDTLELWASSLRDVKGRIRPLFTQNRVTASAGGFLDGCSATNRAKPAGRGWPSRFEKPGSCRYAAPAPPWRASSSLAWYAASLGDLLRLIRIDSYKLAGVRAKRRAGLRKLAEEPITSARPALAMPGKFPSPSPLVMGGNWGHLWLLRHVVRVDGAPRRDEGGVTGAIEPDRRHFIAQKKHTANLGVRGSTPFRCTTKFLEIQAKTGRSATTGLFAFWRFPPLSPRWSRNAADHPVGSARSGTYLPRGDFCQRIVYIMRYLPTEHSLFQNTLLKCRTLNRAGPSPVN